MYPTITVFNMTTGVGFHFLNSEGLKAFFPLLSLKINVQ